MKYKTLIITFLACTSVHADTTFEDMSAHPPTHSVARKSATERVLSGNEVFIPHTAQGVQVKFSGGEFYTQKDGVSKLVQRANLSPELRGINADQLDGFLNAGYVTLKPFGGEEYGLDGKLRLRGGGPILSVFATVGTVVGIVGAAATGNVPVAMGLMYGAPGIIGGALALPTP